MFELDQMGIRAPNQFYGAVFNLNIRRFREYACQRLHAQIKDCDKVFVTVDTTAIYFGVGHWKDSTFIV